VFDDKYFIISVLNFNTSGSLQLNKQKIRCHSVLTEFVCILFEARGCIVV